MELYLFLLIVFLTLAYFCVNNRSGGKGQPYLFVSVLPIGLGLGILYLVNRKAKALANIDYSFGLPSNVHVSQGNIKGRLPVTFDNASFQPAHFKNLYLRLSYKGKAIGNLQVLPQVTLLPMQQTPVPFEFILPIQSLVSTAGSAITTGKLEKVQVTGTITGEGINKYISEEIDIPLPNLSSFTDLITNIFKK